MDGKQKSFLEAMGWSYENITDPSETISDNFPWTASGWYWSEKNGNGSSPGASKSLNSYIEENSEEYAGWGLFFVVESSVDTLKRMVDLTEHFAPGADRDYAINFGEKFEAPSHWNMRVNAMTGLLQYLDPDVAKQYEKEIIDGKPVYKKYEDFKKI